MPALPTGTITFLFTDIEGSTRLLQQLGDRYADVLADCRRLLRATVQERGGQEADAAGDALFATFPSAREALKAAVAAQQSVLRYTWPDGDPVRVRMGLHTGEARLAETGYVGMDIHRAARICAAGHGGQILLSDATHALVAKDLPDGVSLRDLGEHRLKDLAQPHRLFQVITADLPADFPPLKSLSLLPNNLPLQLTSFIGRRQEIADIKAMLTTARLLTLTGAGGSGKTRLSLQVGGDLLEQYPDGVWLVELAALADSTLVPHAIASALGVAEQPGRALTGTLGDFLGPKSVLLLMDNCEHLLGACASLADALLRVCPNLRILATSREGLGIAGESLYPVPALPVPDPERLPSTQDIVQYEAVRLFTERATAVFPTFRVTPRNARSVAHICHRLDGIPLAIELAAVLVKTLAVEQIVSRLNDRFRLLTAGSRTALPRHQTLRATMDWSYDLLSDRERAVLRRLSVFMGGSSLEAAQSVCLVDGVNNADLLDLLTHLVDKSLVEVEVQENKTRYRLLETVRQYGDEKLLGAGETSTVRRRHLDFFLALAEEAESRLATAEGASWMDRLEAERDNIRVALAWTKEIGNAHTMIRLVRAVAEIWYIRGYREEGWKWLGEAIEASRGWLNLTRTKILRLAVWFAMDQRDNEMVRALGEEQLAISKHLGDKRGITRSLLQLGVQEGSEGHYKKAYDLLEQSLRLSRESGDARGIVEALRFMGSVSLRQGMYARATRLCEESVRLNREIGDKRGISYALYTLSLAMYFQRDYERATSLIGESLILSEEVGERRQTAMAQAVLGNLARMSGNVVQAQALFDRSMKQQQEFGDKNGVADCLEGIAALNASMGKILRAAKLYAAAEALRERFGMRIRIIDRPDHEQSLGNVRTALGETAFDAAWAQGRAMTLEQAIEYALAPEAI